MKIEVTINDKDGNPGVILSSTNDNGHISVHAYYEDVEISIEELKAAIRKLSAK